MLVFARCPAKVNLTFDIVGRLGGGYHAVETLMQAVDLEDELQFDFSEVDEEELSISLVDPVKDNLFPLDDSNLIARAIRLYLCQIGMTGALRIRVTVRKHIPVGAGLAGGSANAAASLLAVNHYFGNRVPSPELLALSRQLGSDVPFCLSGACAVGVGRGDELTFVNSRVRFGFCLVKPRNLALATNWVYSAFDRVNPGGAVADGCRPYLAQAVKALESADIDTVFHSMGNVLEPTVCAHYQELSVLRDLLAASGGFGAQLTGSGPTFFAAAASREAAQVIAGRFSANLEAMSKASDRDNSADIGPIDIWVAESVDYGARLVAAPEGVCNPRIVER